MLIKCLIVFFVAMVPIIELRGAVPIGVGMGMPGWLALLLAVVGNMVPVPFIYKFGRKILEWGARVGGYEGRERKMRGNRAEIVFERFCRFCLKKGEKAGRKLEETTGESLYFALFLFVGIPLPGTGAWTGTLAATLLDLDYKKTVLAAGAGVLLSGTIMLIASLGLFTALLSGS